MEPKVTIAINAARLAATPKFALSLEGKSAA